MIEVNRRLYMDEAAGIRSEGFEGAQNAVTGLLNALQNCRT
jgi:N-formylglutamate amidohydrolase